MFLVTENIRHRKECSGLAPVLRQHTAKALAAIEPCHQRTAALQITGGYSSQARKSNWQLNITSECPLCHHDAPFRHSLFECNQLQDARIALDREDADSIWRIPVATQQPDELLLLFASEHLIEGSILPDMIELLHSVPHAPFVFIDGSGHRQRSTSARLSGWAIVLSTASPDQHASLIREYNRTRVIPSCFKILTLAQTQGDQTVARAELQAFVVALESRTDLKVVTDCQSNLDLWTRTAHYGAALSERRTTQMKI